MAETNTEREHIDTSKKMPNMEEITKLLHELATFKDRSDSYLDKIVDITKRMEAKSSNMTDDLNKLKTEAKLADKEAQRDQILAEKIRNYESVKNFPRQMMSDVKLIYTRTRDVAKPNRAHTTDAGLDFFVPNQIAFTDEYCKELIDHSYNADSNGVKFIRNNETNAVEEIVVKPGCHVTIPGGIRGIVPPNFALIFFNKSGVASKKKLSLTACVIDCGYEGEFFYSFMNNSCEEAHIKPGDKIVQGILIPIAMQAKEEELLPTTFNDLIAEHHSDRGAGGYGSSGTSANAGCACGMH